MVGTGVTVASVGVGIGVTGGSVGLGATVAVGGASVGMGVRGAVVAAADSDGDALGEVDGDGDADGAATRCEEITAAPRSSSATSASAANTVKTVDQRSTGRRIGGELGGGGGAFAIAVGRSSCAVASGSAAGGFSCTLELTARAVPQSDARPVGR